MRRNIVVFLLFVALFLVGCKRNDKIVDEIGGSLLESIPSQITDDLVLPKEYKNYDFEVSYDFGDNNVINKDGTVNFSHIDQKLTIRITIRYNNIEKLFEKEVVVIKNEDLETIEKIAKYILDNTPTNVKENIDLITKYQNYNFTIEYSSSDESVISNDGIINRSDSDKVARLNFSITYEGKTKGYHLNIKVARYTDEERISQISEWLDPYMEEIIANEAGLLPSVDPILNKKINWVANYPGVIDEYNMVNIAYEPVEIKLIASSKVGFTEYTKEYTYNSRGLDYDNKEVYIDSFFTNLILDTATVRTNIIYPDDLEIIQSIVYPNTTTQLRPKDPNDPSKGVKMPGGVKWIVIHDTGNPNSGANAEMHNTYIHNQANSSSGRVASWHYTVDDTIIYQHVPDDEQAWHAGDNNLGRLKGGNSNGIGIETCINPENDYELTMRRTAKLTAQLLYKYNLLLDSVTQHYDFSQKTCPAVIRSNGWWPDFLKMVERELLLIILKEDKSSKHELIWTIDRPEIINYSGKVVSKPINDEEVSITLEVNFEGFTKTYHYNVLIPGMTDEEKVESVHFDIYSKMPKVTSADIVLAINFPNYEATIEWSSSHPDILSETGKYNKPSQRTIVTLTAHIKINEKIYKKTYNIAVS